jgi:hypothetical protein
LRFFPAARATPADTTFPSRLYDSRARRIASTRSAESPVADSTRARSMRLSAHIFVSSVPSARATAARARTMAPSCSPLAERTFAFALLQSTWVARSSSAPICSGIAQYRSASSRWIAPRATNTKSPAWASTNVVALQARLHAGRSGEHGDRAYGLQHGLRSGSPRRLRDDGLRRIVRPAHGPIVVGGRPQDVGIPRRRPPTRIQHDSRRPSHHVHRTLRGSTTPGMTREQAGATDGT